MSVVEITAGTVEPLWTYVQKASDGTALTGSSNLRVQIQRASDGYFLDFNDSTFKNSAWTTKQGTLSEVSSSNAPGWYKYGTGIDTTGWTAGSYFLTFVEVSTTATLGNPNFATGEIRIVTAKASDLSARLPASLVSGRIDASIGAVQSGAIGASGFASGAITSTVLADNAITSAKIATDAIGAAQIAADAIGSSELAASAANEIADALLDRALSGHTTSGTAGEAISNAASRAADIQGRLPSALVSGRIDASVGAVAAGAIDAAAIASGAITSAKLADDAITAAKIADDAIDGGALAASAVTKMQSGLASASAVAALPTAATISAAVVDQALSGHTSTGTVGEALSRLDATVSSRSTLTASGVWSTALPGGFLSGSAGYLVGTYLDATISSRLAGAAYSAAPSASAIASQVLGTSVPGAFSSGSLGYVIGTCLDVVLSTRLAGSSYTAPASVGAIADAVWDESIAAHLTTGSAGKHLNDISAPTAAQIAAEVWATAEGTPDAGTFGYGLKILRQGLTNQLESTAGNPGLLKLYADDATTLLLTWQLRDPTGSAVTASPGEPARRGAAA